VILAGILRDWTATPQRCWFGVRVGYGWDHSVYLTASAGTAAVEPGSGRLPDPVPPHVRSGSRVELPNRDCLLYPGLIGQLLAGTRIEAPPAAPDGELAGIKDWVTARAEQTADQLLSSGQATVTTSRGTLRASLERPGRLMSGLLLVQATGDNDVTGSSSTRLIRCRRAQAPSH
jgi:hypothetical protein